MVSDGTVVSNGPVVSDCTVVCSSATAGPARPVERNGGARRPRSAADVDPSRTGRLSGFLRGTFHLRPAVRGVRLARVRAARDAAPVRPTTRHSLPGPAVGSLALLLVSAELGCRGAAVGIVDAGIFVTFTVAVSVVFTWLSNNTGASLLLAILLHGSIDGTATYVQVLADRGVISNDAATFSTGIGALITAVVAAVVISALTRGKLSYWRYKSGAERFDLAGTIAPATGIQGCRNPGK